LHYIKSISITLTQQQTFIAFVYNMLKVTCHHWFTWISNGKWNWGCLLFSSAEASEPADWFKCSPMKKLDALRGIDIENGDREKASTCCRTNLFTLHIRAANS